MSNATTTRPGNSGVGVGVGEADAEGSTIPLLLGIQSASMAAPLSVGV